MAGFGTKERLIAKMLNTFPGVKQAVKKAYIRMNALVYKKSYTEKVHAGIGPIETVWQGVEESFFGYYDKCPENGRGDVLVHLSEYPTHNVPSAAHAVKIGVAHPDGTQDVIDETASYNWQQGARVMWLSDDLVMYNAFERGAYVAKVYSMAAKGVVKTFERPVQEACGTEFFLSIDYSRIMAVRPDYGYRNKAPLTDAEMKNYAGAGIMKVDYATGKMTELIPMSEIVKIAPIELFNRCVHVVNHLMLSPSGEGFVFVHRFYEGKRRHDRLMYYDGATLHCLLNEDMVSHYCWLDENRLFGYMRVGEKDGFYTLNVKTGTTEACNTLNVLGYGDGHPTYYNGKIVVDTYPDKSRMQHLMVLDERTQQVEEVLEVFQSVKYMNETRCDMHPRFSPNGKTVYFDTVYQGKRMLSRIGLNR